MHLERGRVDKIRAVKPSKWRKIQTLLTCPMLQTLDDTRVDLALDFLSLACFPVWCSSDHPQSRVSLTHGGSETTRPEFHTVITGIATRRATCSARFRRKKPVRLVLRRPPNMMRSISRPLASLTISSQALPTTTNVRKRSCSADGSKAESFHCASSHRSWSNLSTSLVFLLYDPDRAERMYARLKVPAGVRPWIPLQADVEPGVQLAQAATDNQVPPCPLWRVEHRPCMPSCISSELAAER